MQHFFNLAFGFFLIAVLLFLVLEVTQLYPVVRDTLEPQHRLINTTSHFEVAMVVAGVNQ